jgi:hypothetical protein
MYLCDLISLTGLINKDLSTQILESNHFPFLLIVAPLKIESSDWQGPIVSTQEHTSGA